MDVRVGTFNLNNLFGRWNLYVDAPPPPTRPTAPREARPAARAATRPPRDWLEAPAVEARPTAARRATLPDVKVILEGDVTPEGIKWRTNPYTGKVVYKKSDAAHWASGSRHSTSTSSPCRRSRASRRCRSSSVSGA